MAEGWSRYIDVTSDQTFTQECDLCKYDDIISEGVSFCVDCQEYMCLSCLRAHRRNRASIDHRIREGEDIDDNIDSSGAPTTSTVATVPPIADVPLCYIHKNQILTLFCKNHDEIICDLCKTTNHRRCSQVLTLKEASRGTQQLVQDTIRNTQDLTSQLRHLRQDRMDATCNLTQNKERIKGENKRLERKIIQLLKCLREEVNKKVDKFVTDESRMISSQLDSINSGIGILEEDLQRLQTATALGQEQAFIAQRESRFDQIKQILQDIQQERCADDIKFDVSEALETLLIKLNELGTVTIIWNNTPAIPSSFRQLSSDKMFTPTAETNNSAASFIEQTMSRTPRHRVRATKLSNEKTLASYAEKTAKDTKHRTLASINHEPSHGQEKIENSTPNIIPVVIKDMKPIKQGEHNVQCGSCRSSLSSCLFLDEGHSILCYFQTKRIQLVEKGFKLKYSLELAAESWDVTIVSNKKVVVSLPGLHALQYVIVDGRLHLGQTLYVGRRCYGVVCSKNKLYVSCYDPYRGQGEVLQMNLQGHILSHLGHNADGSYQFISPQYLAVDCQDRLYVSDSCTDMITCLTADNKLIYTYKDEELRCPFGVLVDIQQNLYVCGNRSNNVQVISPTGEKITSLLTSQDGVKKPYKFAYRHSDNTIMVGMFRDTILVLKLL